MDGWTDIIRRIRAGSWRCRPTSSPPRACWRRSRTPDFEKMEEIRARVDADRRGPGHRRGAEALVPAVLQAAVLPRRVPAGLQRANVTLVDTDGKGVERITETGVVVDGVEYEVDCLIYATGFEVGTDYTRRAGFDVTGRGGVTLSERLGRRHADAARHARPRVPERLPRAADAGREPDLQLPHNLVESGQHDRHDRRPRARRGPDEVEATAEAEDAWIDLLLAGPRLSVIGSPDCTPGYYNNEGQRPPPPLFFFPPRAPPPAAT